MAVTRISTQLIRDLAITTAKIAANAVTLGKLGALSSKGSLISHDGSDHVARTVGANDEVLTADSGQTSGLKWATVDSLSSAVPLADLVFEETPTGTIDGANTSFTLANTPHTGTVRLYLDGVRMRGGNEDYSISGTTITFEANQTPQTGQTLIADYIKDQS